ncbi:uncharacterized protein LOC111026887 [Myzus persicae]|uniref:uncharacterized protein LOC111026887 n=1 Tax=Myzus persicae TaxID=13164 RepID=UPI000B935ADC|nr:uncharacterized protein LOC111026887 [Myzus persicae]
MGCRFISADDGLLDCFFTDIAGTLVLKTVLHCVEMAGDFITTKTTFEGKPTDYWVLTHYKSSNIVNVALKDRWRHSEASVKIFTSDKSKDQSLNSSLNQTMQAVFDTMLQDLDRRTIKSKIIFSCVW